MTLSDLWRSFNAGYCERFHCLYLKITAHIIDEVNYNADVICDKFVLLSYSTGKTFRPTWCWALPVSNSQVSCNLMLRVGLPTVRIGLVVIRSRACIPDNFCSFLNCTTILMVNKDVHSMLRDLLAFLVLLAAFHETRRNDRRRQWNESTSFLDFWSDAANTRIRINPEIRIRIRNRIRNSHTNRMSEWMMMMMMMMGCLCYFIAAVCPRCACSSEQCVLLQRLYVYVGDTKPTVFSFHLWRCRRKSHCQNKYHIIVSMHGDLLRANTAALEQLSELRTSVVF